MISKYRADIDGLRAIAVLSVILFHLHVAGLTGGYVGVDIFFVISGYLITSLIYEEITARKFSLRTFYLRRIRRIAPALVVTLIATAAVSFLVLKPEELRSFATSLALQPFSAQNFFFLSEGEYFVGADLKPLLHTWSLAVEEQFYLFWPLLLLILVRHALKVQLMVLVAILLASFAANMLLMGISPKASFFMLPTRAWELGAGGLVAILEKKAAFRAALTPIRRSVLGAVGLALMAYSFVAFSAKTPFPGTAAILPVAASLCVLLSGIGAPTFVGRALSIKPLVAIGLISYPMYLWHWPIISLSHQFGIDPGKKGNAAAIMAITLVLAALTYKYVEEPIRFRRWMPQPSKLVWSAAAAFGILFALGIHLWITNGAAYRYSAVARNLLIAPLDARKDRCGILFKALHPRDAACTMVSGQESAPGANNTKRVLLWGNSHADQ
ncbi:MAG: acyltransferase, partial [Comamonadaceae bacterium]